MKTLVAVTLLLVAFLCPVIGSAADVAPGPGVTTTAEVQLDLPGEWLFQYGELIRQIQLRESIFLERVSSTVFRTESLILPTDRDPADVVLRRTSALLDRALAAARLYGDLSRPATANWPKLQRPCPIHPLSLTPKRRSQGSLSRTPA